ncbi:MAG: acetyl-CoA C-acetyltransferase [bacterium]|nr:acetyl-CoA C-acetyltransferase [bacterium]
MKGDAAVREDPKREAIVLAGPVRTPIGKFGGSLADVTAVELATHAFRAALDRAGVAADQVDQAILGHARQAGCGPNPGRQASVACGIPVERPARTVNQACLSGLQAILDAERAIRLGEAEVVLVGGTESMSRVPYMLEARWGYRMGHQQLVDGMYRDGFVDPISGDVMGRTAETLATRYEIPREEQDAFAAETQRRCEVARRDDRFADEIVPIEVGARRGVRVIDSDEHPRDGVTAEALRRLKPVFDREGTVTAGNSSGITDGAAAMLVLSGRAAARLNVTPAARIVGHRISGVEPAIMGIGPVPAVRDLLKATGFGLSDIDLVELNEAFAAQVLAVARDLELDLDRTNVNGGAIALGHPIGCSGTRVVVTLLHEMRRRKSRLGLATLCASGGMGGAMIVENADGGE